MIQTRRHLSLLLALLVLLCVNLTLCSLIRIRNVVRASKNAAAVASARKTKVFLSEEETNQLRKLLEDMKETLLDARGVGLAAPQVGVLRRIVVVECEEGNVIELINPRIIARAGKQEEAEGCLSVPGRWGITDRPRHVTVRAMDRYGNEFEVSGSDLLARAFCHEIDHLDGHLYTELVTEYLDPSDFAEDDDDYEGDEE